MHQPSIIQPLFRTVARTKQAIVVVWVVTTLLATPTFLAHGTISLMTQVMLQCVPYFVPDGQV